MQRKFNGKWVVFLAIDVEQLDIDVQKKIISCIMCKPNSKQIIDLTVEPKAIKLLENIGEDLCYLGLGKDFSDVTPKAWSI